MKLNCLLAGVGGQGIVLASKLIAQTAIANHHFVRTSETIGMAQRGGCVVSHVRIGTSNCSPSVPAGLADLIIGFEPAETARSLPYLKPQGGLVVNTHPITPVTAAVTGVKYHVEAILDHLRGQGEKAVLVDGRKLCRAAGSSKVLNAVLLGVAINQGLLPFTRDEVLRTMRDNLPERFIGANSKALEVGCRFGQYL